MDSRRKVVNAILQSIKNIPDRESFNLSQVIPSNIDQIPPLQVFLEPPPDIEDLDEHTCGQILLGSYRPMRSPGIITLYNKNLINFFWRLVLEIDAALPGWNWREEELKILAKWVVDKTYFHERFHHSMDVLRHLFDVQTYDRLQEEALAVAYARNHLYEGNRYRYPPSEPQHVLLVEVLRLAFCYTSPGYRDWHQYPDLATLQTGVSQYLNIKNSTKLRSSCVPMEKMVFSLLLVKGGFEERVI